jgi:preprotein translocase subunit SecG
MCMQAVNKELHNYNCANDLSPTARRRNSRPIFTAQILQMQYSFIDNAYTKVSREKKSRRTFKRKLTIPSTKDIICKSDSSTSANRMGKQRKKSDTGAAVVESFLEEMTMIMMMTMILASMLFFCLFKNARPKRQQKKEKKKNQKKRQTETRLLSHKHRISKN